jgi:predicted ATPase/DNA-binding SARP family transcriptional activator
LKKKDGNMVSRLNLQFLGLPQVYLDDEAVVVRERSVMALLAYLAVNDIGDPRHRYSREALSGFFWPEVSQTRAFTNLRHTIWAVHQAIGENWLVANRESLQLDPVAEIDLDIAHFQSLSSQASQQNDPHSCISPLVECAKLYRNHFLTGFRLKHSAAFHEWSFTQSEELRRRFSIVLTQLIENYCTIQQPKSAIPYARRLITLDPINEPAHRQLMEVYLQAGQQSAALKQYQTCEQLLRKELNLDPQPETRALYKKILKGEARLVPVPKQTEPTIPKNNLPLQLSSFVGREKEQADVMRLIAQHRLVTITGAGGVGKTRLSMKVGAQIVGNYLDGVWLVELAPILDPSLVPHTTALAIGLREDPQRSIMNSLSDYLYEKKMLLLFDNCEHILEPCAQLIDALLKLCPDLKILVTSREALNLTGEAIYRVPSLGLPKVTQIFDTIRSYESMQLFEARAQLVQFDFSLTPENAASVAQICQRLDGIPLAIEFAAAKVAMLSTEQIAKQLQESFNLLVQGSRTALPRHRTLRASMDWSWDLLTEAEQRLVRQLAVFAGGWTLEAARSVCDGDVVYLLNSLVTKSLIVITQRTENNARYSFHETIRQYAREKLAESGESESLRGRHLDYFLAVALRFEQETHGPQLSNWIMGINAEHDNLLEAMNWAGESGQVQSGLRLGSALHYYWLCRGYWSVGRASLERLLARPEASIETPVRADALNLAADLATKQGDLKAAWTLLGESIMTGTELGEIGKPSLGWARMLLGVSLMGHDRVMAQYELDQSLVLLREAGEPWRLAIALLVRGWLAANHGDFVQARDWFTESLSILRDTGDKWTSADPTGALGWVYYCLGEYATAAVYCQQALEIYRAVEDKFGIPGNLANLGAIALIQGNAEQAARYFEEKLAIVRELMNKAEMANALCDLGIAVGHLGNYARATALLSEGLELSQEIGNTYLIAACLTGLVGIQKQPRYAVQMLAAAQAAFERSGEFINPLYRIEHERIENKIRGVLGGQDFVKFLEEGQPMTLEQAVTLALEPIEEIQNDKSLLARTRFNL